MDKISRHFVSKLRRLENNATPGPWAIYGNSIEDAEKIPLVTLTKEHFDAKNAEFITELRNAAPGLLRLIEQQDNEIKRLKSSQGKRNEAAEPKAAPILQ